MRQPAVTVSFPQDCEPVTKSTSRVSTHLFATSSLRSHRHPSRKSGAVLQLRHLIAVQSPDHDNLPPPQPQLKLGTVTDYGLECIATLQQLRCVDVRGCTHFSGAGLFMMASGLPRVENLSLENCPQVTDDDLMVLASVPVIPHNFRCVKLSGCWGVTGAGLKHLANFHELWVLHLTCSGLTDDVLTMIAHALPSLRQVELGGCWTLSNDGLASFVAPLKFLQRLKLVRCIQLSDVGMAAIAHVQAVHRSLLELELSGCADVTDDGILSLATFVRTLTHLQIVGCPGVTDHGLAHLCRLLPLLQHLKLGGAGCTSITDSGLMHISRSLLHLHYLSLTNCADISDDGLASLASLPLLRYVELGACRSVTDHGVASLESLPRLQRLTLVSCPLLTNFGLQRLISLAHLDRLVLRSCENLIATTTPPTTTTTAPSVVII